MANYFYVKSGGSLGVNDDTPYSSQQTGSFASLGASNYYDSIAAATSNGSKSNPAVDGDVIFVSDSHNKSFDFGTDPTVNYSGSIGGAGVWIISVSDTAIDTYSPGAVETLNDGTDDWKYYNNVAIHGVSINGTDNSWAVSGNYSHLLAQDCTFSSQGSGDFIFYINYTDNAIDLKNVVLSNGFSNAVPFQVNTGPFALLWQGGSFTGTSPAGQLLDGNFSRGMFAEIRGVDLSALTTQILGGATEGSTSHLLLVLRDCQLNSGVTLHGALYRGHRFEMYNCDDSTGAARHRFYIADFAGTAQNNDSCYIDADEAWGYDGTTQSSIQVVTTAHCNHVHPFAFTLPAQWIDLSNASTDKITIELTSDDTGLTHGDIAAFLCYPDQTTPVTPNWVNSQASFTAGEDPLTTTALSASSLGAGDWTGEPGSSFYKLELDTSGLAGDVTACEIRIEVYDSSLDGTSGHQLFISPQVTVGT